MNDEMKYLISENEGAISQWWGASFVDSSVELRSEMRDRKLSVLLAQKFLLV